MPKGFKKRYFSLQAITASVSQMKLVRRRSAVAFRLRAFLPFYEESSPPKDPDAMTPVLLPVCDLPAVREYSRQRPCHCNRFFSLYTFRIIRLNRLNKPLICRCRHRKTGLAPPPDFDAPLRGPVTDTPFAATAELVPGCFPGTEGLNERNLYH